jgi:hypothetical protein
MRKPNDPALAGFTRSFKTPTVPSSHPRYSPATTRRRQVACPAMIKLKIDQYLYLKVNSNGNLQAENGGQLHAVSACVVQHGRSGFTPTYLTSNWRKT